MKKYMSKAAKKAPKNERISAICKMIHKGFDRETILVLEYTEEEYAEAMESLLVSVSPFSELCTH